MYEIGGVQFQSCTDSVVYDFSRVRTVSMVEDSNRVRISSYRKPVVDLQPCAQRVEARSAQDAQDKDQAMQYVKRLEGSGAYESIAYLLEYGGNSS